MSDFPRGPRTLDELEQRLRSFGAGKLGPIGPLLSILGLLLLCAWTSVYTVQPEGEAVVKRFGRVVAIREPGLHFKLPFGIDRAYFVPTARVLKEEFGFRTVLGGIQRDTSQKSRSQQDESLMLTGDLKVINVEWVVQYRISDPDKFLHRVRDPAATIRDICESVMRRIVGNSLGSDVLTEKRVEVSTQAKLELQEILDSFEMGVQIGTIELQDVTPPEMVKPATVMSGKKGDGPMRFSVASSVTGRVTSRMVSSPAISAKRGLSLRKASSRPWMRAASADIGRSGLR